MSIVAQAESSVTRHQAFIERRSATRRESDLLVGEISRSVRDATGGRWIAESMTANGVLLMRAWFATKEEAARICARWAEQGVLSTFYSSEVVGHA